MDFDSAAVLADQIILKSNALPSIKPGVHEIAKSEPIISEIFRDRCESHHPGNFDVFDSS